MQKEPKPQAKIPYDTDYYEDHEPDLLECIWCDMYGGSFIICEVC